MYSTHYDYFMHCQYVRPAVGYVSQNNIILYVCSVMHVL